MSITMQTGPNAAPPAIASFATRLLTLCYGGLAYLIFLGTFLYAVGFVSAICRAQDHRYRRRTSSLRRRLLINLVLMSIFAVQHSVMARQGFKSWWTRFVLACGRALDLCAAGKPRADAAVLAVAADADGGLEYRRSCSPAS